jgi:sugar lactone lactonase YvrE
MRAWLALFVLAALLPVGAAAGASKAREPLDLRVFARVPEPGQPEPIAIGRRGRVYVGTNQLGHGDADAPSKIFVYSRFGELRREYVVEGQNLSEDHGIQGLAFNRKWRRLFALDRSADPRVIVINPRTGRQRTYAHFRDVPPCSEVEGSTDCSATTGNAAAEPDYAAFGPGGALYVTDIEQALIWRVPRGGGSAHVWLTDPRLESVFGPNGIQFIDRRTLLLAVTSTFPSAADPPASGALFEVPLIGRGKRPGELELFWRSEEADGPDGFALGRSGTVYLALAGASQIAVISPAGEELARVPSSPIENLAQEIPVDGPGSLAFLGRRVLVSNHSPILGNPSSWAVLDLYAGERGLPLFRPRTRPRRRH